jgi:hypothetical protein
MPRGASVDQGAGSLLQEHVARTHTTPADIKKPHLTEGLQARS